VIAKGSFYMSHVSGETWDALVEAVEELLDSLTPACNVPCEDPAYGLEVKALGERIGYGALMSSASASWAEYAERQGIPGSQHVSGPCYAVLTHEVEAVRELLKAVKRDR
jgi:hypothetical protein